MNMLEKSSRPLMSQRGFTRKRGFWKFLPGRSLLVEVSFSAVQAAFTGQETFGWTVGIRVYYPAGERFILVSPAELANLRRDGTLRHVVYTSERGGIFSEVETETVGDLIEEWFDFWYEKLTEPQYALETIEAFRGRASLPSYLSYLSDFIAKDDAQKLEFELRQEACIFPFDGGVNFNSYAAYLNSAGRFVEAQHLIEEALDEAYFRGQRHAVVALQGSLKKIAHDSAERKIALSESNVRELAKLGLDGKSGHP